MVFNEFLILVCLSLFSPISGCGQLPQRQARTLNFEITGFKQPAAMVYSLESTAPSKVSTISTSEQQAVTFVQNIIMQSVEDIFHQQGRGAGLSDDLISLILNQIDVTVQYTLLKCDIVFTDPTGNMVVIPDMMNCQIISGTVTKTCNMPVANNAGRGHMCPPAMLNDIEAMYLNISGSITMTNVIIANWSTQMWQIVLNRALRSLSTGPLRSQFIVVSVTLK